MHGIKYSCRTYYNMCTTVHNRAYQWTVLYFISWIAVSPSGCLGIITLPTCQIVKIFYEYFEKCLCMLIIEVCLKKCSERHLARFHGGILCTSACGYLRTYNYIRLQTELSDMWQAFCIICCNLRKDTVDLRYFGCLYL